MVESSNKEPLLEMFVFESSQLLGTLEELILDCEKTGKLSYESINEIFRIMHTIKGSSSMMMFTEITSVAHLLEDIFFFMRENKDLQINMDMLFDVVLAGVDFIKLEIIKIENGDTADGSAQHIAVKIKEYLSDIKNACGEKCCSAENNENAEKKENDFFYISTYQQPPKKENQKFQAIIFFSEDCQMENIRAYTLVHNLKEEVNELTYVPKDILDNDTATDTIQKEGFRLFFSTSHTNQEVQDILNQTLFLKSFDLKEIEVFPEIGQHKKEQLVYGKAQKDDLPYENDTEHNSKAAKQQNIISVNVSKLDKLMDLVGEIVITESMVTRNPDLAGLQLNNFVKAARQLRKLNDELQDVVMSIRMIPIAATFHKMHRILRDMGKKLGKDAELEILGEETEVDKNIIDNLSDPLMHLIRNAMDHGIEAGEERQEKGKSLKGKITLEAKNTGGDVVISITDDGKGLNKDRILEKAREKGLINKPETELSDREIFSYIMLPGFSTKEQVTEFSGRGVGMDVVKKNIEKVGGTVSVESFSGQGTKISIKIPLTLAIIDGMEIAVGKSIYTLPTVCIKESFRAEEKELITDPDGNEMMMIRGSCYPVVRLHKLFKVKTEVKDISKGIIVVVENNIRTICLFADGLLGKQQVVVKPLPQYLSNYRVKESGVGGCTILGDGSISLILDAMGIINGVA